VSQRVDAIVGQHGVDPVGECRDHATHEGGTHGHLGGGVQLDVGELAHAIDGEEQVQLALGRAQLARVDVDVADLRLGEALPLGGERLVLGQPRDAVPLQATMKGAPREGWDALAQAAQDVVQRQERAAAELDDGRLLELAEHRTARLARPHPAIGCGGARAPFGDGLRVQPLTRGEGAGRPLRRLELGSNPRRRAG
jgi:hypothetical protein